MVRCNGSDKQHMGPSSAHTFISSLKCKAMVRYLQLHPLQLPLFGFLKFGVNCKCQIDFIMKINHYIHLIKVRKQHEIKQYHQPKCYQTRHVQSRR